MKYRIEIQQVFQADGYNADAEWLQDDRTKPNGKHAAICALHGKFNASGFKPPMRLVAISPSGSWFVVQLIESPHKPAPVIEPARRSLTADSAWFLVRTMGPITGMRGSQIERFLRSSTPGRIEDDAEGIQVDFYSKMADKVQEVVVGRVIES